MTKGAEIRHAFVDSFPQPLEEGFVYVSIPFATVAHLCRCGCGNQVITELSRKGWRLTYDGETISLYPSIGNWSFPCKSHYWITRDRVEWAAKWSEKRIRDAREAQAIELKDETDPSPSDHLRSRRSGTHDATRS